MQITRGGPKQSRDNTNKMAQRVTIPFNPTNKRFESDFPDVLLGGRISSEKFFRILEKCSEIMTKHFHIRAASPFVVLVPLLAVAFCIVATVVYLVVFATWDKVYVEVFKWCLVGCFCISTVVIVGWLGWMIVDSYKRASVIREQHTLCRNELVEYLERKNKNGVKFVLNYSMPTFSARRSLVYKLLEKNPSIEVIVESPHECLDDELANSEYYQV